ncbi:folate receptor alpha-like [Mercenaria mercenaria]|uniref:folate receptor alpha-like n=1 Tax=Mercenaria mercenaria TaxID=6596 RepID=UPI00234EF35E|nr:folate receptor alpha-like [Mercenaria mercenaria]
MTNFLLLALLLLSYCCVVLCRDHPNILDTCFDAKYHKLKPVPEPNLHGLCSPWKSRACCESNTTLAFHLNDVWIGFTWNHCPGHNLSESCRNWFMKDLCFYECSPNTGPWITEHKISIRNERFQHTPLCTSQCTSWWEACKDDYTCLDNWGKGFNWTTGVNTCPVGTTCQLFSQMFKNNATAFCNQIWDYSWKVVPDTRPCMKINFTGTNPNDAVAEYYANINATGKNTIKHFLLLAALLMSVYSNN